jgi:hypothetical protein
MEPKRIKKLVLKKETIAQLSQQSQSYLKGGCTNSVTCGNPDISAGMSCGLCNDSAFTYCYDLNDCATIGHDDGTKCVSKTDWGWCWCYGI